MHIPSCVINYMKLLRYGIEKCRISITCHRQPYSKLYSTAKPYFVDGSQATGVNLNRYSGTILKFNVGGRAGRKICGQVTRPNNQKCQSFIIKPGTRQNNYKARIQCNVVIKPNYSVNHRVGDWYLTIWYEDAPTDYYGEVNDGYKVSSRRTVR